MPRTKKDTKQELTLEDKENNKLESEYFEINLDTFLFNAGVIGFIEVLEEAKEKHKAEKGESLEDKKDYYLYGQTLFVKKEFLLNIDLSQVYIDAVCNHFKEETFSYKLKNENTKKEVIKEIMEQFKKNQGKYKIAFNMINNLRDEDYKTNFINDIDNTINKLLKDKEAIDIIDFYSLYGYFSPFIGNWGFLDSSNITNSINKGKSVYLQKILKNIFNNPIKNLIDVNESTDKCFICNIDIDKTTGYEISSGYKNHNISFINSLGGDINKKTSHFWNHNPDVIICPICAFIYACMPIGFINIKNDFIFINNSESIKTLLDENKNYKSKLDLLKQDKNDINYFQEYIETKIEKNEKEIEGIEFIINRYDKDKKENKYTIKNIDKTTLSLLSAAKNYLNIIYVINISCKLDNKTSLDIFNECIDNIFRNINQYNLIHKIFITKYIKKNNNKELKKIPEFIYYIALIQITKNYIFTKEGGENMQIDRIKQGEEACYQGHMLRIYIASNIDAGLYSDVLNDKIKGMSFKLANAIQTCNFNLFRDILFHTYIALGKNIPTILMDMRESNNTFKDLGYSYLAGLNGAYRNKNKENNEEEGE